MTSCSRVHDHTAVLEEEIGAIHRIVVARATIGAAAPAGTVVARATIDAAAPAGIVVARADVAARADAAAPVDAAALADAAAPSGTVDVAGTGVSLDSVNKQRYFD